MPPEMPETRAGDCAGARSSPLAVVPSGAPANQRSEVPGTMMVWAKAEEAASSRAAQRVVLRCTGGTVSGPPFSQAGWRRGPGQNVAVSEKA